MDNFSRDDHLVESLAKSSEEMVRATDQEREAIKAETKELKNFEALYKREISKSRHMYLAIVIPLFGILAHIAYEAHISNVQLQEQRKESKANVLEKEVKEQEKQQMLLNSAISEIRNVVERAVEHCHNGKFTGDEEQFKDKKKDAEKILVNVSPATGRIFNDALDGKVISLLGLAEEFKAICSPNSLNTVEELKLKQKEINGNMEYIIRKNVKRLKELRSSPENVKEKT